MNKIVSLDALARIRARLKQQGKRVVFTNGCFDILHFGHVQYLEKAKSLGDVLIVGLNSDASVRRIKGKSRPLVRARDRAGVLAGMACVDYIVIFGEDTPYRLIVRLKPDVLVKGADWKKSDIVGADIVTARRGTVATVRFAAGRSTSAIIEKIKRCATC